MSLKIKSRYVTKTVKATKATVKAFNTETRKPVELTEAFEGVLSEEEIIKALRKKGIVAYKVIARECTDSLLKMSENDFASIGIVVDGQKPGHIQRTIDTVTVTGEMFNTVTEEVDTFTAEFRGIANKVDEDFLSEYVLDLYGDDVIFIGSTDIKITPRLYSVPLSDFIHYAVKA